MNKNTPNMICTANGFAGNTGMKYFKDIMAADFSNISQHKDIYSDKTTFPDIKNVKVNGMAWFTSVCFVTVEWNKVYFIFSNTGRVTCHDCYTIILPGDDNTISTSLQVLPQHLNKFSINAVHGLYLLLIQDGTRKSIFKIIVQ